MYKRGRVVKETGNGCKTRLIPGKRMDTHNSAEKLISGCNAAASLIRSAVFMYL